MASKVGRYDSSLEDRLQQLFSQLENIGIRNVTKVEATALMVEKEKRARMPESEVRDFFARLRGLK